MNFSMYNLLCLQIVLIYVLRSSNRENSKWWINNTDINIYILGSDRKYIYFMNTSSVLIHRYVYLAIGNIGRSNQLFPNVAFPLKDLCILDIDFSVLNLKQNICELYTFTQWMRSHCGSNIINLVLSFSLVYSFVHK